MHVLIKTKKTFKYFFLESFYIILRLHIHAKKILSACRFKLFRVN